VTTAAIVPAAGRGVRLGPGPPKALRLLGGAPLLVHALRALGQAGCIDVVNLAVPRDDIATVRQLVAKVDLDTDVRVLSGGETRQRSVALALRSLPGDVDVVLVHDAARPLVPADLVSRVEAGVRSGAAAVIPALPVPDTLKEVQPTGAATRVVRTLDRSHLRRVQTPQGFRRDVLAAAHAAAQRDAVDATDDAGLVERIGVEVLVVPGAEAAFKVTDAFDLVLAEAVLARRAAPAP
jgi:2-C-methyl-D-erythritol 4-phosphate cytidylyltransferase